MEKKISFNDAKKEGLKFFFTGLPCDNGHISKRRVYRKSCLACEKERIKRRESRIEFHLWSKLSMARYHDPRKSKRARGVSFSREEFFDWVKKNFKGNCYYCNISLDEFQKKKIKSKI